VTSIQQLICPPMSTHQAPLIVTDTLVVCCLRHPMANSAWNASDACKLVPPDPQNEETRTSISSSWCVPGRELPLPSTRANLSAIRMLTNENPSKRAASNTYANYGRSVIWKGKKTVNSKQQKNCKCRGRQRWWGSRGRRVCVNGVPLTWRKMASELRGLSLTRRCAGADAR
jgi:hypothetical protein